jgi:hypothetical protein
MDVLLTFGSLPPAESRFALTIFGGICGMLLVVTIAAVIQNVLQIRQQEQTRREIAAYVAEGTISPDDAVKILSTGRSLKSRLKESLLG